MKFCVMNPLTNFCTAVRNVNQGLKADLVCFHITEVSMKVLHTFAIIVNIRQRTSAFLQLTKKISMKVSNIFVTFVTIRQQDSRILGHT